MSKKKVIIASAVASVLAMSIAQPVQAADQEKCYGIVKKGMNDCAAGGHSCAGSAVKNNQGDAFVMMPKGLCDKLVGGSLTPVKVSESGKSCGCESCGSESCGCKKEKS